jgi:hypothetical protein
MSKKKMRKDQRVVDKIQQMKLDQNLSTYADMPNDDIYDLSTTILSKPKQSMNDKIIIHALKNIIDGRDTVLDNTGYYPDIKDPKFNENLYKKKEMFIDRIPKVDNTLTLEELTNKLCRGFKPSFNQKFLKKFISEYTNYNGLLLFHGTGVGKTCSSISIAEQLIDKIASLNKKVIILLNPSIKANFIKNIFNIERLKQNKVMAQCTQDKYMKEVVGDTPYTGNMDTLDKKIMKLINSRYTFYGYTEFSNLIEKIVHNQLKGTSAEYKNQYIDSKIKRLFSDTVMIIDEAHNIKESSSSKDGKILPPLLKRVLNTADNMKLVLLSATPMFDNATEIVWLLNLLLINDKRQTITIKDIFDKHGAVTLSGTRKLLDMSRGYISYLRGEHPAKFPKRLYPDIYDNSQIIKKFPNKYMDGTPINENQRIKTLKIMGCPMINTQLKKYNLVETKTDEQDFGPFNLNGMMASNIIFPSDDPDSKILDVISQKGFFNLMKKSGKHRYEFRDTKNNDFFKLETLRNHSSKIAAIIENTKASEGVIFIYSQFIYAGVLPIALALESNGYSKLSGSLLKKGSDKESDHSKKYIMITGDNDLSHNTYQNYLKLENENQNGEKVKVIIGSSTAAEGLDFKNIREVHILEPWHHLNKLEQVIGRAIRNCSHTDLPFEKRNVTVYMYGATKSNNPETDSETIDLKMYRISETKSKKMSEVERLLKMNAVDCNLNKEENRFIDEVYTRKYDIITAKNTKHTIAFGDVDGSKSCNYDNCDFKCIPNLDYDMKNLDTTTYSYDKLPDAYNDTKNFLIELFATKPSINIKNIEKEFYKLYSAEYKDVLYLSLNKFILNNVPLTDKHNRQGVLRKRDNLVYFVPKTKKNQLVILNNVRIPTRKKLKALNMSKFKDTIRTRKLHNKEKNIVDIMDKIKAHTEYKSKLIVKDRNYTNADKTNLIQLLKKYPDIGYDYLNSDYKESLIKNIILGDKDDDVKIQMIDSNIIYMKRDYNPFTELVKDHIWGYKIAKNDTLHYYKLVGAKFEKANSIENKQLMKITNIRIKNELISNNLIGYIEEKQPEKLMVLKIRDKQHQGDKGTHIKTGSVCGNDGMKKGKIINFIHTALSVNKYSSHTKSLIPGKPNLCNELELYLRSNENSKKSNNRWFYTYEEAIERGLNKKK